MSNPNQIPRVDQYGIPITDDSTASETNHQTGAPAQPYGQQNSQGVPPTMQVPQGSAPDELSQNKKTGGKCRGVVIAAIVVGLVLLVGGSAWAIMVHGRANSTSSAAASMSKPHANGHSGNNHGMAPQSDDESDTDMSNTDDAADDNVSSESAKTGMTLEQVFETSGVKEQFANGIADMPDGVEAKTYAVANTVHVDFTITDSTMPPAAYATLPKMVTNTMLEPMKAVCRSMGISSGTLQVDVKDASGSVLTSDTVAIQ